MNLHRTGKRPGWEDVRPEDRNIFQRLAARTHGILTPANFLSVAGALLVVSGLRDVYKGRTFRGAGKIIVGRTVDIIDGQVAERTGTKSPLGEALDAATDKAAMAAALPVLYGKDVLPGKHAKLLLKQNAASAGLSLYAKLRGRELHPSEEGKHATLVQWATVGFFALAAAARYAGADRTAAGLEGLGSIAADTAADLGSKAIEGYVQDAMPELLEAA